MVGEADVCGVQRLAVTSSREYSNSSNDTRYSSTQYWLQKHKHNYLVSTTIIYQQLLSAYL